MKRFINVTPECDSCKGQLALEAIQIDLPNCCYILHCECITCGEEEYLILALDDFVEINQLLNGGSNERLN